MGGLDNGYSYFSFPTDKETSLERGNDLSSLQGGRSWGWTKVLYPPFLESQHLRDEVLSELLLQNLLFIKQKTTFHQIFLVSLELLILLIHFCFSSSSFLCPTITYFILICILEMLATPIFLFCVQFLLDH